MGGYIMRKSLVFFIVLLFLSNGLLISQKNSSPENLSLAVDYSLFKKDNDNSYLEIYYSFSPNALTKNGGGKITELLMRFIIKNLNTNQVEIDKVWNLRNEVKDTISTGGFLVGLNRFILNLGQYSLSIRCFDLHNKSISDSLDFNIVVPPNRDDAVALSDVEICNSIKQIPKDTLNIFYKNTLEVKPNPTSIIHHSYPLFGYYIECYNLLTGREKGSNLNYIYKVVDNFGKEYISRSFKKQVQNSTGVETGIINLNNLPGGSFNFVFAVNDTNNRQLTQKTKKFFIYNPNKAIEPIVKEVDMINDFSYLTEEEVNKFFLQSKYIANLKEIDQFNLVKGVEAKRNFLAQFWQRRQVKEKEEDINKEQYEARIKFANERFRTKYKEGWFTERGRVTLTYGIPEETFLERGKEDRNGRPYEIWYYPNIMKGVYFIFTDETGFNDYRLVHSSHPNEVHDQDWQEFLKEKK
jgi:GWxTD domain-containing protein